MFGVCLVCFIWNVIFIEACFWKLNPFGDIFAGQLLIFIVYSHNFKVNCKKQKQYPHLNLEYRFVVYILRSCLVIIECSLSFNLWNISDKLIFGVYNIWFHHEWIGNATLPCIHTHMNHYRKRATRVSNEVSSCGRHMSNTKY